MSCMFVFASETQRLDTGLSVELWNKGMLWDKLMGTHWLPLVNIRHSNTVSLCAHTLFVLFHGWAHVTLKVQCIIYCNFLL
jgi:hypothetical protein